MNKNNNDKRSHKSIVITTIILIVIKWCHLKGVRKDIYKLSGPNNLLIMKSILFALIFALSSLSVYGSIQSLPQRFNVLKANSWDFNEFFAGLWDGISTTASNDYQMFQICSSGFFRVFTDFSGAQEFLKSWLVKPEASTFLEFIVDLSGRIAANLLPCYIPYLYITNFRDALAGFNWEGLLWKVARTALISPQIFYLGFTDLIGCLKNGRAYCAGENLGKMGYTLIFH